MTGLSSQDSASPASRAIARLVPTWTIASNSGCTTLLVDGAMTPSCSRHPSASAVGCSRLERRQDAGAAFAETDRGETVLAAMRAEDRLVAVCEKAAVFAR